MMIEILKMRREELVNKDYKVNGESVRTNLEVSLLKKPLSRAQAKLYRALRHAKGDQPKTKAI